MFFSNRILVFLPDLSRTFLWCHKITFSILNTIDHLSLLTLLFAKKALNFFWLKWELRIYSALQDQTWKTGLMVAPEAQLFPFAYIKWWLPFAPFSINFQIFSKDTDFLAGVSYPIPFINPLKKDWYSNFFYGFGVSDNSQILSFYFADFCAHLQACLDPFLCLAPAHKKGDSIAQMHIPQ